MSQQTKEVPSPEYGHSCIDCGAVKCNSGQGHYPDFCLTTSMEAEERDLLMKIYGEQEVRAVMANAAQIEYEGYCRLTRVEETIQFAHRMGYERIGIATCAGLIQESRVLGRILRANGFQVYGIACKAGAIDKSAVGIDPVCERIGIHMCNPVFQARELARAKTQLNIVVGLCVGHDSLFYRYSECTTTTLVVKDRVTGHNPAAALYTAGGYYKTKLFPSNESGTE